ncbi:hypothetical protein C4A50_01590 [Escherichia coli]|nr:hypothetical protein [Escherichia coli]EFO1271194.1 hypothetical protein [Escherichia albertii]RZN16855.1 hypothetical protein D9734_22825 [Escherichia sp. E14S1]TGB90857.1 hypothetical protein CRG94_19440 [Escherichia sp. E3356]EFN7743373.1 hypothetical protein [Escherichia coli]
MLISSPLMLASQGKAFSPKLNIVIVKNGGNSGNNGNSVDIYTFFLFPSLFYNWEQRFAYQHNHMI